MNQKNVSAVVVALTVFGSTVSLGVFILPSVVYHEIGAAVLISYLLSSVLVIPTALSMAELGTAMPGHGGAYFYVGRSMGSMLGFFAGVAKWLAMSLKGAFALGGMIVITRLVLPELSDWRWKSLVLLILLLLLILETCNERLAHLLYVVATVAVVLGLLAYLVITLQKTTSLNLDRLKTEAEGDWFNILKSIGLISIVYYEGLIKIAAMAPRLRSPGRSVPTLIFASFGLVALLFIAILFASIAHLSPREFYESSSPVISVGEKIDLLWGGGHFLRNALLALGLLSLFVTASLSFASASHVLPAMAQDGLLPKWLQHSTRRFISPTHLLTALLITVAILFFDINFLVKIASGMLLLLFTLMNLAVIVLRESKIVAYRPTYSSPFYPLAQIIGLFSSLILIFEIGNEPLLLTLIFFILSSLVYLLSNKRKQGNEAAVHRLVNRMINRQVRGESLDDELTRILQQRDNIKEDRFDNLIRHALVLDVTKKLTREELFNKLASALALKTDLPVMKLFQKLKEREQQSTTLITPALAIPHLVFDQSGLDFVIIVLRCLPGIEFSNESSNVDTVFCLAGSPEDRNFHLQALMSIAQIVQDKQFLDDWQKAHDEEELRNAILLAERQRLFS